MVASKTVLDLSNQRDDDVAEDTTRTDNAGKQAARYVKSKLGDVDGDDETAVELGVRYALMLYSQVYPVTLSDAGRDYIASIKDEIDAEAEARVAENTIPELTTHDYTELDKRYPTKEPWDGA